MKCRRSLTLDPKIVRGEQGAADPRRSSARQRLYRPHASGGRPSSVYWCGLQAGRDRPGNDWRVNQTKNRVRIAVSFTLKAHLCGLVPSGSLAGRSYVPVRGSRPWWSAADGCCVAARPARRVRVGLPGLVTSAVTGSMAAVQAPRLSLQPRHRSNSRARKNTPSSISSVNFLVLVFCWLTW